MPQTPSGELTALNQIPYIAEFWSREKIVTPNGKFYDKSYKM